MTVSAAILMEEPFRQGYEILSASTLELTRFDNTYVEGTIRCDRDGLLYTSIPQNSNWSATVDGEEAEVILVGECMVALRLQRGEHTVSFTYRNEAFSLGWKISLGAFALFGLLAWRTMDRSQKTRKKGRFER